MPVPYLVCMLQAAQFYSLPPRVLPSIQAVEGGFAGAVHPNKDGSDDLGVMQVNTRWVPRLAALTRLPPQTVHDRLVADPCFNIAAAAFILKSEINATGDLMRAVGNYHSHTPALHAAYRDRVWKAAARLFWGRGG